VGESVSSYTWEMILRAFPGSELIERGIEDLRQGTETIPALLVSVGAVRLRRLGLAIPERTIDEPEIHLYLKLQESDADSAHSRYNALIRTLTSFERAAECAN
jgi:hypothetical protein